MKKQNTNSRNIGFFVGLIFWLVCFSGCGYEPSQWEIATQCVAQKVNPNGELIEAMRLCDSTLTVNDEKMDNDLDKWLEWLEIYLTTLSLDRRIKINEETKTWRIYAYSFAWDYWGTCYGWPARKSEEIYPVKMSWWKHELAQYKYKEL